jgi:hypothetical protein
VVTVKEEVNLSSKSFTALTDIESSSTMKSLQKDILVHSDRKYLSSLLFFLYSKESEALTLHIEVSYQGLTFSYEEVLYGASTELPSGKVTFLPIHLNKELNLLSESDVGSLKVNVYAKSKSRRSVLAPNKVTIRYDVVLQSTPEFTKAVTTLEGNPVSIKNDVKKSMEKKNKAQQQFMPPDFMQNQSNPFFPNAMGGNPPFFDGGNAIGNGNGNFPPPGMGMNFPPPGMNFPPDMPPQMFEQMMMAHATMQQQQHKE